MGAKRRTDGAGPSGGRDRASRLRGTVAVTLAGLAAVAASLTADDAVGVRLVKASSSSGTRVLATTSLYARNDRWKPYLASEETCPGGERTDLPLAQQTRTLACLINWARARRGLRRLVVVPKLTGASLRKATEIIRCRNFDHNPCGGDWRSDVLAVGYRGAFGENLYMAGGRWGAPRVAVDGWLNSPPHRHNLFRSNWRTQGLVVVMLDSFEGYSHMALWVNVFGDR